MSARGTRAKKWTSPSGRQTAPKAIAQSISVFLCILKILFSCGRSWHTLLYRAGLKTCTNKSIVFIHVSGALTEAMLDHLKERSKSNNEHLAAWERYGKMQNERHAPQMGPPKGVPPKSPKPYILNVWGRFLEPGPLEHPRCARQKMNQSKWAPKSAQSDRAKYY